MEKELALAIDFKKAPEEVQKAATSHYDNVKKVAKLKAAMSEKDSELKQAEADYSVTERALKQALKAWTPEA